MNEKIRQLMLEAGYAAPEIAGRATKLVELIVRECAEKIAHNEKFNWLDAAQAAKDLREHFGVE